MMTCIVGVKDKGMNDDKYAPKIEDMMEKRKEPIFWLDNKCPFCNHSASFVYTPDLLKGPIEFECPSKNNTIRIKTCYGKWSVALELDKRENLLNLIKLAEKQDHLYKEISKNRILLGYGGEE